MVIKYRVGLEKKGDWVSIFMPTKRGGSKLNNNEFLHIFYGLSVYDFLVYLCATGLSIYNFSFRAGGTKSGMGGGPTGYAPLGFLQNYGPQKQVFLYFG